MQEKNRQKAKPSRGGAGGEGGMVMPGDEGEESGAGGGEVVLGQGEGRVCGTFSGKVGAMNTRGVIMMILSIGLLVCSVGAAALTMVFLMAGGANAKPEEVRLLKIFMFVLLGLCVVSVVGAVTLMVMGRPGWSIIFSVLPGGYCVTLITWMVLTEF